jgi:hypothetical protein
MGLVPEDTRVPLQALIMLYESEIQAQGGTLQKRPSVLNIRRWLKILIDRSLVLGPVERPSLHDLVLDYSVGLHEPANLRDTHRCFIDILRERRPGREVDSQTGKDIAIRYGWTGRDLDNPMGVYVSDEVLHHIRHAWLPDWQADTQAIAWLDDFPGQLDKIAISSARFLGDERTKQLAMQAEKAQQNWAASVRWAAAGEANKFVSIANAGYEENKKCVAVLESMEPEDCPRETDRDLLLIFCILEILTKWDHKDVEIFKPKLD